jgi:hypothetical protein
MHRLLAIIERDLRRFKANPTLVVMSLMMPLLQLIVLGYVRAARSAISRSGSSITTATCRPRT